MNAIVEKPTTELEAEAASVTTMLTWAQQLTVSTAEDYEKAGEGLRRIKARAKALDEKRKELTQPLDALKKKWMDFFRGPQETLAQAEAACKKMMIAYQDEQDRIRKEAERQAAEAARKERERLEREAAKLEEKARQERAKAEAKAAELEAAGNAERAEAMRRAAEEKEQARQEDAAALQSAAASMPLAPVVEIPRAEAAGTSTREVWRFAIENAALLPREYLVADEQAIGAVVRALKGRASIPGVRVYSDKVMSARSA